MVGAGGDATFQRNRQIKFKKIKEIGSIEDGGGKVEAFRHGEK